jgi:hypothetical protein
MPVELRDVRILSPGTHAEGVVVPVACPHLRACRRVAGSRDLLDDRDRQRRAAADQQGLALLLVHLRREAAGLECLEQRVRQPQGAIERVPRHLQVEHLLRRASHARRVIPAVAPLQARRRRPHQRVRVDEFVGHADARLAFPGLLEGVTDARVRGRLLFGQRYRPGEAARAGGEGGQRHLARGSASLDLRPVAPRRHRNAELLADLDQPHVRQAITGRDDRHRVRPDLFVQCLPADWGALASHRISPSSSRRPSLVAASR